MVTRQAVLVIWRGALACIVVMVVAAVGWITVGRDDFPAAQLLPSDDSLEIRETWIDSSLRLPVTIENHSSRSIEIREVELSDPVAKVHPLPLTIAGRQRANLELCVDGVELLSRNGVAVIDDQAATFAIRMRPITNWGRVPLPWRLRWTARPVAVGLPTIFQLGKTMIEGTLAEKQVFDFELHELVDQFSVRSSSPHVSVEVRDRVPVTTENSRRRVLVLTPQHGLTKSVGSFQHALLAEARDRDGKYLATLQIPIAGTVMPDLECHESVLVVTRGSDRVTQSITLSSRAMRPLEFINWRLLSQAHTHGLNVVPQESTRKSSLALDVSLDADHETMDHFTIRLFARYQDDGSVRSIDIDVHLLRQLP